MADNETIADIIAWLRKPIEGENAYLTLWRDEIADRFEAAHKRELARVDAVIDEAVHGYPPEDINDRREIGDAAKLREALDESRRIASDLGGCRLNDYWKLNEIVRVCEAALAAPPRNCEVGTAEDWLARFSAVCERCSGSDCDHRLFKDEEVCDCFARWLQMPYKEGGAK